MMASADLPIWAIREMISSAVNLIVQLSRFSDGTRKVTYITEVCGQKDGIIQSRDLFRYLQSGVDKDGKVEGAFAPTGDIPSFFREFKAKGIDVPETTFKKQEGAN
jgi:pilus assembly protein CpaF